MRLVRGSRGAKDDCGRGIEKVLAMMLTDPKDIQPTRRRTRFPQSDCVAAGLRSATDWRRRAPREAVNAISRLVFIGHLIEP